MAANLSILLITTLVQVAAIVGLLFVTIGKRAAVNAANLENLKKEFSAKQKICAEFEKLYADMIDAKKIRQTAKELTSFIESLKTERGRITLTQAELETVENRLRELEEIERELQASNVETEEETRILNKRHEDLEKKHRGFIKMVEECMQRADEQIAEGITLEPELEEKTAQIKTDLDESREKIEEMLKQIEMSTSQYTVLKKRYDALDIEYAQLYEKFAESAPDDDDDD